MLTLPNSTACSTETITCDRDGSDENDEHDDEHDDGDSTLELHICSPPNFVQGTRDIVIRIIIISLMFSFYNIVRSFQWFTQLAEYISCTYIDYCFSFIHTLVPT